MKNGAFVLALAILAAAAWGAFYINTMSTGPSTPLYSTPINRTVCIVNITNTSDVRSANFTVSYSYLGTTPFSNLNASSRSGNIWTSQNFSTAYFGYWTCKVEASDATTTLNRSLDIYIDYPNDWPMYRENRLGTGYSSQLAPPGSTLSWNYAPQQGATGIVGHITAAGPYVFAPVTGTAPGTNSSIYALNVSSGARIWNYTTNGTAIGLTNISAAAYCNGIVYFTVANDTLDTPQMLYASNGTPAGTVLASGILSRERPNDVGPNIVYSPPICDNATNAVIFPYENSKQLAAYDLPLTSLRWTKKLPETLLTFNGVADACILPGSSTQNLSPTTPAIAEGLVFVSGYNTTSFTACYGAALYAINISNGNIVWNNSIYTFSRSSPVVGNGLVYLMEANGNMTAYYARNGSIAWSTGTLAGKLPAWQGSNNYTTVSPVLANGSLYAYYNRFIVKFNATTGLPSALLPGPGGETATASPAITRDNKLILGTESGNLYVQDADTLVLSWTTPLSGGIYGTPAMANGLFVGGVRIYGFNYNASHYNCLDPLVNCYSPNVTMLTPNGSKVDTMSGTVNFNASILSVGYGVENTTVYYMLFRNPTLPLPGGANVTPWAQMNNLSSGNTSAFNKTFDTTTLSDGFYSILVNASDLLNNTAFLTSPFIIDNGGDVTAPNASFVAPINATNVSGSLFINLSVNDSGSGVAFVQLRFENSSGNATGWLNTSMGAGNLSIGFWNLTFNTSTIADGIYNITANASDYGSNANKTANLTVIIDNTFPLVKFGTPPNQTNTSSTAVGFNFTPFDAMGIKNCSLWLNLSGTWAINMSNTSTSLVSGTATMLTPTAMPEGRFIWGAQCYDFAGNGAFNESNRTLAVDLTAPLLNVVTPINGSTVGREWSIILGANDSVSGILNGTYRVEQNGANFTYWLPQSMSFGDIFAGTWSATFYSDNLTNGVYNITFNFTDFADPENASITYTVTRYVAPVIPPPPPPPPPCDPAIDPACPPPETCGNGACAAGETCSNCPADCGECPPPPCDPATDPACPPPPCDPLTDPACRPPPPCDPATDPSCQPLPPPQKTVCDFDTDCPGDMYCLDRFCAQLNGTCGFAFDHKWNFYECCTDRMCGENEYCDLALHECILKFVPPPPPPPPEGFRCAETCGIDGSGKCCSGYCEASVCRLNPPGAAQAVTLLGGTVQLRSACAGLGLGLDEFSCNLIWVVLLILAALAGYAGERTRGRLMGAAMLLLPLFIGLVTYVSLGMALALFELFALLALKPRAY